MTYNLSILRRAQKELAGLPEATYERVKLARQKLSDDPKPRGSRKLSGRNGWCIRVDEYLLEFK